MTPAAFEKAPVPRPPHRGPTLHGPLWRGRRPRARASERVVVRLWIPLLVIWVLLSPFLILLSPFIIIGLAAMRVDPFRAIGTAAAILHSLGGTQIDVEAPDAFVKIHFI